MVKKDYTKREKKKIRIRKKIFGTIEQPRISIYRSLTQIYAQIVDDSKHTTLVAASSKSKEIADDIKIAKSKTEKSKIVGKLLAQKAKEKGIEKAVFDRSGYEYHGRVKAIAEGIREGGVVI
ncbi:MAG: 50S ribosomal protein L18 [bacterium]